MGQLEDVSESTKHDADRPGFAHAKKSDRTGDVDAERWSTSESSEPDETPASAVHVKEVIDKVLAVLENKTGDMHICMVCVCIYIYVCVCMYACCACERGD